MKNPPRIVPWPERPDGTSFAALAELWNVGAAGRHGYFPWTENLLARQLVPEAGWSPDGLLLALDDDDRPIGAAQTTAIHESSGYEPMGALELLVVRPEARRRGVARALVAAAGDWCRARGLSAIDAMGAWPYGPHFHALADGSERSGVFDDGADAGLAACLAAAGFVAGRGSVVMRINPVPGDDPPPRGFRWFEASRRADETWLDHTFRAWSLRDHLLADADGYVHSRAIYARMDGLSEYCGRGHFALFGVYTAPNARRCGFARLNLARLLGRLAATRGAAVVELHCYADNTAARGLYDALGFGVVARTRAMRKAL